MNDLTSDCSRASMILLIPRGFGDAAFRDGSLGGMTGRPTNSDCVAIVEDSPRFFASVLSELVRRIVRIYS